MSEDKKKQNGSNKLVSLSNYIEGLWKLGGLPLVLIGIGAANIFVPDFATYGATEHLFVTAFMFVSGVVTWGTTVFLAYQRWKTELDIVGQRERQLIQSICEIIKTVDSDAAAKDRVQTLTNAVESIKLQKVQSLTIHGDTEHKG